MQKIKYGIITIICAALFFPISVAAITIDQGTFSRGYTLVDGNATLAITPQTHDQETIEFGYNGKLANITANPGTPFQGVLILPNNDGIYGAIHYRLNKTKD